MAWLCNAVYEKAHMPRCARPDVACCYCAYGSFSGFRLQHRSWTHLWYAGVVRPCLPCLVLCMLTSFALSCGSSCRGDGTNASVCGVRRTDESATLPSVAPYLFLAGASAAHVL